MAGQPKRRRRSLPEILSFSSFARYVSNSRPMIPHISPLGSKIDPEPEPRPTSEFEPPAKTKPKRVRPASTSFSDEEEEEEEASLEMVQADFGFFDPKPRDFGGVKLLLQNYLDDRAWNLSEFVDLIVEQTTVGTVVKLDGDDEGDDNDKGDTNKDDNDDDEDVYAFISALNLGRYSGHRCIGELKKFILDSCTDDSMKKKLKLMLDEQARNVGLLVSQRFVNCPLQLVLPLYDGLFDEVSWATEDEPTQELRDSFRFKFYVLITKIYENKNVKHPKGRVKCDDDEAVIYVRAEDEIFRELSSVSFTFPLHAEQLAPQELKNYRATGLIMVVKADKVPKFRTKLKSLLAEP